MTRLELFVYHALDHTNIGKVLPYIQESFTSYELAVLEVMWGEYPNGYYYVTRFEIRDPKAYKAFPDPKPERKFLVFEEFPTEKYVVEIINRDLVKWLIDRNFEHVEHYPVWEMPEYLKP